MNQQQQEQVGRVFCYKPLQGFGFIYYSGGKSIFFHKHDSRNVHLLSPGDSVSFTIAEDFQGRQCAIDVRRAESGPGGAK